MNWKLCFVIVSVLLSISLHAQETEEELKISYEGRRDSVLFETSYGSIYFTRNSNARFYNWYGNDDSNDQSYSDFYTDILSESASENQFSFKKIPTPLTGILWSDIYNFNDQLCLYSPSDWFTVSTFKITDSTIFDMRSADPTVYFIESYTRLSASKHAYNVRETYTLEIYRFVIEILDEQKGISLWIITNQSSGEVVKLVKVKSENVKLFPAINEDCGDQKCIFNQQYTFFSPIDDDFLKQLRK